MIETKVRELADWPIAVPVKETNRERIIRALREADGVVPQCFGGSGSNGDACTFDVLWNVFSDGGVFGVWGESAGLVDGVEIAYGWNDTEKLTVAQIADRLDSDEFWNERADEEFKA